MISITRAGWSITRLKAYMTIDMVYCVNDRFSKLTPLDVTFTSFQEEYLHEIDVTFVLLYSYKSTWINTVSSLSFNDTKNKKSSYILYFFYDIDIFEMTTYANLLTQNIIIYHVMYTKWSTPNWKVFQLSDFTIHFYYMMIETEIMVAQMSCKVFIFAQYIIECI